MTIDCGTIEYLNKAYNVHWHTQTKHVYISKIDNPALAFIHYPGFVADTPQDARNVALNMLKEIFDD